MDVEIASRRSRSHYSASSRVSQPATSESEGLLDDQYRLDEIGDEDNGDDHDEPNAASITVPVQLSKKKYVSTSKKKHDDALLSEV